MSGRALALLLLGLAACGDDLAPPDAAPTCPLAAARCIDTATLERCEGSIVAQVACGPGVCLAAADGASCREDGDACGAIDTFGVCVGEIAVRCAAGSLDVLDCGAAGDSCVLNSGAVCRDACSAAGVTSAGVCVGTDVARCAGTPPAIVIEDCLPGTACEESGGGAACAAAAPCSTVGPAGRCDDDVLVTCSGGVTTTTACADSGEVCGYDAAAAAYACGAAGVLGASVVHGRAEYQDRPPLLDGLGGVSTAPIRGALVTLVADSDDAVLAASVTSDDGSYTLRHAAAAGTQVHITIATTSPLPLRPATVVRPGDVIHGQASASFAAAAAATVDVLATQALGSAEAFNVFDQLVTGEDAVVAAFAVDRPTPIAAVWGAGSSDGTYYWQNEIHLLGGSSDDDGNDDAVILHEFGHHIEDAYGRTDTPGGYHDGTPTDPNLAWSEGFATFSSCALRQSRYYMDSLGESGWSMDLEATLTPASASGTMTQAVSEFTVSEILWDALDAPSSDDDDLDLALPDIFGVQREYLRPLVDDRGVVGVDLVDFLDGWLVLEGGAACDGLRGVVATDHLFPYDFAPVGAACP